MARKTLDVSIAVLGGRKARGCASPPAPAFPEPAVELSLMRIQGEADRLFGDILEECAAGGRWFPDVADSAFRKRDSGEALDPLERRIISLFGKIDAIEMIKEMKPLL